MAKKIKKIKKKIAKIKLFQTKVTTAFFAFIGIFTLSFIGTFLYFQVSDAKDVDEILPAEDLIILAEFSREDLAEFLEENESFKSFLFDPLLQQYLNQSLADFNNQSEGWLGDKMAFATYKSIDKSVEDIYYLFLENNDQKKAIEFLHNLGLQGEELTTEEYKNVDILAFSQSLNVNCSFLYGYLICSNEASALEKIIDLNQSDIGFLSSLDNYNKVKNNLPKMPGGKIYFNLQKFDFNELEFYLGPIKEYLKEGGIAFTQIDEGVRLNSYLSLEKGLIATDSVVKKNNLDKYVTSENVGIYLAGSNLTQSFEQILNIWDEVTPYFAIIIEGMLRARVADYFGMDVSLEEDLYVLFENNYAVEVQLTIPPQLKIILEVDDEEEAAMILEKMLEGVYAKNEKFKAEKKETALKDGSVVKELLVNDSKVQKVQTDFNGIIIHSVKIEGIPLSFAYAIHDEKVFISLSESAVQENLELLKSSKNSLSKHPFYAKAKKTMFLEGEESSFFDLQNITKFLTIFGIDKGKTTLLSNFDYAVFSTKWFDDGMANEVIFLKEGAE